MRFSLKIGTKLLLGFLLVVAIFGGSAYYQIRTFQDLAQLQDDVAKRAADALEIKDIMHRMSEVYTVMADGAINRELEETRSEFTQSKTVAQEDIATVRELVDTEEEQAWAETLANEYTGYLDRFEQEMLPLLEKGESAERRFADALAINVIARRVDEVYTVMADGIINRNVEETMQGFARIKKEAADDTLTVQALADTAEEETWAETFGAQYNEYLRHFEKELLPILEKEESAEKRFADALVINAVANRVNEVYAVMADGVINQNIEETLEDFTRIKQEAEQDIATVQALMDTAEEEAWAGTFAVKYQAYLSLFETQMIPLLRRIEYTEWEDIQQLDEQIDQLREAALAPLREIVLSLEQESSAATQDMLKIRELDEEIDAFRVATLEPLNNMIASLERESAEATQDTIRVRELDGEIDTLRAAAIVPLDKINDSLVQENAEADQLFDTTREQVIRLSMIISVAGGVIALVFAIVMTFSITWPLKNAVTINNQLADGNLNIAIRVKRGDEIGQLQTAMKHMVEKLREVATTVTDGAMNVSSGSEEMAQGASEQASSVEEASSSMEEMAANIRQNADNARETEKIAIKAAESAREGGRAVSETLAAMQQIAEKITIIEEIARQTHMLSLNATIEAAKAQDYGKGFGVVAAEVRALSERSRNAATEINALANTSLTVAERAGGLLNKMLPDIQRTAELVQEISAASTEQSSGAEQINKAIQQLDQVVQQNASVSEELASQAEELRAMVEFFKIDRLDSTQGTHAGKAARPEAAAGKFHVAHIAAPGRRETDGGQKGLAVNMNPPKGDELDDKFERY